MEAEKRRRRSRRPPTTGLPAAMYEPFRGTLPSVDWGRFDEAEIKGTRVTGEVSRDFVQRHFVLFVRQLRTLRRGKGGPPREAVHLFLVHLLVSTAVPDPREQDAELQRIWAARLSIAHAARDVLAAAGVLKCTAEALKSGAPPKSLSPEGWKRWREHVYTLLFGSAG